MDIAIASDTFDPDSHFLFWKPGATPWEEPAGMSWRLDPGNDLILNVHLQPTGKPELIQPSVGFYFTREPQTRYPMLLQLEHDGALDIPPGDRDFLASDDFRLPLDVGLLALTPTISADCSRASRRCPMERAGGSSGFRTGISTGSPRTATASACSCPKAR